MKRNLIKATVAGVVCAGIICIGCKNYVTDTTNRYYPRTAVVTEVDYANDIVSAIDATGNIWEMTETDDWLEGDVVSMLMDDNGTPEILDDRIVKAYYSGFAGEDFVR